MSFQDLLDLAGRKVGAARRTRRSRWHVPLESMNIGIEPDVLGGAKLPKPDEKVVLFAVPPAEVTARARTPRIRRPR